MSYALSSIASIHGGHVIICLWINAGKSSVSILVSPPIWRRTFLGWHSATTHPPSLRMGHKKTRRQIIQEFEYRLILFSVVCSSSNGISWEAPITHEICPCYHDNYRWILSLVAFALYEYCPLKKPLIPMHLFKTSLASDIWMCAASKSTSVLQLYGQLCIGYIPVIWQRRIACCVTGIGQIPLDSECALSKKIGHQD